MHVNHARQNRSLRVGRVVREAQHELVDAGPQQRRREDELVAEVLAHDAAPHGAGAAAVRGDGPRLDVLPVDGHRVRDGRVLLGRERRPLVVPVGRLGAREVDRERRLLIAAGAGELGAREVELHGPVVDVVVDGLRAQVVGVAGEPAPVHVVEVVARGALPDLVHDARGEVAGEVPLGPVDAVLRRPQRLAGVGHVAVLVLARRLVRRADAPDLRARALGRPFVGRRRGRRGHGHVVLDKPPENAVGVHGESVGARFDHGDLYVAGARIDLAPVLQA